MPAAPEGLSLFARAADLIVEHEDGRFPVQAVAAVGPEIGGLGFPPARGQLPDRGLVGVEHRAKPLEFRQPVGQGLEGHPEPPHPLGQGRQGQRHPLAGRHLRQAIERRVVEVLADLPVPFGEAPHRAAQDSVIAVNSSSSKI